MSTNWRDIAFKAFWTLAAGALAALVPLLSDAPNWWALVLLPLVNAALAFVRQRTGATPPVAPARETGFNMNEEPA